MHALKTTWHVHCFTCAACKAPIRTGPSTWRRGPLLGEIGMAGPAERAGCRQGEPKSPATWLLSASPDYEKMFGTKCRGCDFKIDAGDRFLEALGFSWHDTCFVCAVSTLGLQAPSPEPCVLHPLPSTPASGIPERLGMALCCYASCRTAPLAVPRYAD